MRALLIVVLVAAAGWSGYWFVGARALDHATERWLTDRREEGWVAEAADTRVRGFPNRFDLTLSSLELADPETGLAWSAPFFQVLALSYKPGHLIAVWPPEQSVATPNERIGVSTDDFRGSLILDDVSSLELDSATLVAENMALASNAGWTTGMDTARLAVRRAPASATTYEVGVEALGFELADSLRRELDPSGRLPSEVERLLLDAEISFDRPWDRRAIEAMRPQPTEIDLRDLRAQWGRLDLRAAGELSIDPDGVATGRITVKAVNWREILEVAVASGALPETVAPTLERALGLLARASGSPETLDAPLQFSDGRISYGPIPLGPAPRFVLR